MRFSAPTIFSSAAHLVLSRSLCANSSPLWLRRSLCPGAAFQPLPTRVLPIGSRLDRLAAVHLCGCAIGSAQLTVDNITRLQMCRLLMSVLASCNSPARPSASRESALHVPMARGCAEFHRERERSGETCYHFVTHCPQARTCT